MTTHLPTTTAVVLPDGVERCNCADALMIYCPDCSSGSGDTLTHGRYRNASRGYTLSEIMRRHQDARPTHRPVYVRFGRPQYGHARNAARVGMVTRRGVRS